MLLLTVYEPRIIKEQKGLYYQKAPSPLGVRAPDRSEFAVGRDCLRAQLCTYYTMLGYGNDNSSPDPESATLI